MNDKQILEALDLEGLDSKLQEQALQSINNIVEMRVSGLIEDMMTKEQAGEFAERSETEDKDTVMKWISEEVTDVGELHDAVLKDYIEERKGKK